MTPKTTRSQAPSERRRLVDGGAHTPDELAIGAMLARLPEAAPRDDLAVERVWRRLVAPTVSSRPRLLWIPAVAALAAALMIVVGRPLLSHAGPVVELAAASGGVFSTKLAESWRSGTSGEELAEGDRVRTDTTGRAVFRVRGVAAVLVDQNSDVGLERLTAGTFLWLSHGTLTARVSKRSLAEPFVVETDHYAVKVVGTLFSVEQGPGDHTAVSVRDGIVEVSDRLGRVDRVVAGQRWTSEARDARTPDRTPDAVKTLLEEGLEGKTGIELASLASAVTTKPPELTSPAQPWRTVAPGELPSTSGVPSPEPAPVMSPPRVQASVEPPGPAPVRASPLPVPVDPPSPPQAEVTPAPSSAPSAAPPAEENSYARGRELEARGDLEGAARQLAKAADEDAAQGDIALYALGRLAQRRLHDPARASSAYRLYRSRYPHGALLPEVDLALLEIEVDTHAGAAALADSTRFLATHPTSERLDEVHLLRGNLLRDADNCREALGDYSAVHASPFADHAAYSTAYCQRKLGDRLAAAATLRDYLARFPNGAHRPEAQRALTDDQ